MKEIEWAELRINDGDGGDYLNIYSDDKTYSYLLKDVFERINETDLARITAERARYRHDLARAIAWIDERASFSEADKFAGTTLFETWQEVQAALKQSS